MLLRELATVAPGLGAHPARDLATVVASGPMTRIEQGLWLGLFATLSGCSLLVKDVSLPACTTDAECDVLNVTPGDEVITACMRYQCSAIVGGNPGTCVYRPLDADDDGHTSAMCPGGDDCDDGRASVYLGHAEVCDGLDNDCDLVIDDGDALTPAPPLHALDTSSAASLTWGTAGSGTYTTDTGATYTFALAEDGRLRAGMPVVQQTNAYVEGPQRNGFNNVATTDVGLECATRKPVWLATPECGSDSECPAPRCTWGTADGGASYDAGSGSVPLGACETVDGGFADGCHHDTDCAWPCASERCVPPARTVDVQVYDCALADLATSPIGSEGAFAVGIQTNGCGQGRLRAGWLDSAQRLLMYGPEARSNVWLGVDVGAFPTGRTATDGGVADGSVADADGGTTRPLMACSGAGRGVPGAARPSVAALGPATSPEALAVYLSDARSRARCGDLVPVPVLGLGLFRETASGPINAWVTGTNDGHPESFGRTNGGGPPAVAAVSERGWVVAYPRATTTGATPLALHYVGRPTAPAPFSETLADGGAPAAHLRRATVPLAPRAPFFEVPAGGRADYVGLAVGARRGATYDLGVTWLEDCASSGNESVWFSLVRFDPAAPESATSTEPVQLSTSAAPGGFPAVVYGGAGGAFVASGWARAGGSPVAPDARGGFVVAWAGTGRTPGSGAVYAVRVSEADGLALDDAPRALRPEMGAVSASSVALYTTPAAMGATVGYHYWDSTSEILDGHLVCPAP